MDRPYESERAREAERGERMREGDRERLRESERMREGREASSLDRPTEAGMSPRSTERDYGVHPVDLFRRYTREMDRMFDRMLGGWGFGGGGQMYWPAIETFERDDRYVVRAEMPGMKPEDVRVRVVGDTLVIDGERRNENRAAQGAQRSEWSYGRFHREMTLPNDLDSANLRARMDNGVLELEVPYREGRRSREIQIERGELGREATREGRDATREESRRTRH